MTTRRITTKDLSPRQIEIINLIVNGAGSRKEIAEKLGVGTETVKTHCREIMRKFGVPSVYHAAMRFYLAGQTNVVIISKDDLEERLKKAYLLGADHMRNRIREMWVKPHSCDEREDQAA